MLPSTWTWPWTRTRRLAILFAVICELSTTTTTLAFSPSSVFLQPPITALPCCQSLPKSQFALPVECSTRNYNAKQRTERLPALYGYAVDSVDHNMEDMPIVPTHRSRSLPRSLLRKLSFPLAYIYRCLFRASTSFVAAFMTAVLTNPDLQKALSHAVMNGINLWLTQDSVKTKLFTFQQTMANTSPSLANPIGQDFFKVIIEFLEGIFFPDRRQRSIRRKMQVKNKDGYEDD